MNDEPNKQPIEPELEARIVALVMGEASDFECEELNRLIALRPELAAFKLSMQHLHGMLTEVGQGEFEAPTKDWKLPSKKRNAVLAVLRGEDTVLQAGSEVATSTEGSAVAKAPSVKRNGKWNFGHVAVAVCVLGFMGILSLPSVINDQSFVPKSTLNLSENIGALPTIVMSDRDIEEDQPVDTFFDGDTAFGSGLGLQSKAPHPGSSLSAIQDTLNIDLKQPADGYLPDVDQMIVGGSTLNRLEQIVGQDDFGIALPGVRFDDANQNSVASGSPVNVPDMLFYSGGQVALDDVQLSGVDIAGKGVAGNRVAGQESVAEIGANASGLFMKPRSGGAVRTGDQLAGLERPSLAPANPSNSAFQNEGTVLFGRRNEAALSDFHSWGVSGDGRPVDGQAVAGQAGNGIDSASTWQMLGEVPQRASSKATELSSEIAVNGSSEASQRLDRRWVDQRDGNETQQSGKAQANPNLARRSLGLQANPPQASAGGDPNLRLRMPKVTELSWQPDLAKLNEKLGREFGNQASVESPSDEQSHPFGPISGIDQLGTAIEGKSEATVDEEGFVDSQNRHENISPGSTESAELDSEAARLLGREGSAITMKIGQRVDRLKPSRSYGGEASASKEEATSSAKQRFRSLMPLLLEEELLSRELGDGHPKLEEVQKQIRQTEEYYEKLAVENSGQVAADDGKPKITGPLRHRMRAPDMALPGLVEDKSKQADTSAKDLAELTDRFDVLMAENRFSEAERVAEQGVKINSDSPESMIMLEKAKMGRLITEIEAIKSRKNDSALDQFNKIEESVAMPFGDYGLPELKTQGALESNRSNSQSIERQIDKQGSVASQDDGYAFVPFGAMPDNFGFWRRQSSGPSSGSSLQDSKAKDMVTESEKLELSKGLTGRSQTDLAAISAMTEQNIAAFTAEQPATSNPNFGVTSPAEPVGDADINGRAKMNLWMTTPALSKQQSPRRKLMDRERIANQGRDFRYQFAIPDATEDLSLLKERTLWDSKKAGSKPARIEKQRVLNRSAATEGLKETLASSEAFSTFSLHVSDVSFQLAKAALEKSEWPEAAKVRIEEFVNAFDYADPMPRTGEKVACVVEQSIHPFLQQRNLLRVSMKTAAAGRASSTALRLTLLLDNSGSMERIDRQQTVRLALSVLAKQLKPSDHVTLISFARQPRLLADKVSGDKANQLVELIDQLPSEGGTNIEAALQLAFEKAKEHQSPGAQNRIILLTDGAVNLGNANPESLSDMVKMMRTKGIAFDAAGISAEGLNDEVLEALTRQGDGRYYLLDSAESADSGFAAQIAGAMRPSAKNVKVQVEFNPKRVGKYKLLGFRKHRLNKEDFRNDKVDAAEMAAAEAGVAMYQFEPMPDGEGDVGSVSVRFLDLSSGQMVEHRWPIPYVANASRTDQANPSLRIAASAALLAAKLRNEPLGESVDLQTLAALVSGLPEAFAADDRVQSLQRMIEQARQLSDK